MQFKNLKDIRVDRDIKQREIAKYLNVSQNTYSQYETGIIALTAEILIKLSDYYEVSIDFLLDRTNDPKRYYLS
ncbi:MAG: helix-turn-helix transcriptional regulator [Clostridia bacterium]|nr:helix-turn-helix transcriptional regulator [Clostridia bacterium]